MTDPEDELREEIDQVERRVARTVDLGSRAMVIAAAVFVLIVGLVLPWLADLPGYDVLLGTESEEVTGRAVMVPRLFAATSLLFGVLASAVALMTRLWVVAWVAAIGGWFASVDGVLAIWACQSSDLDLGIGLILAEIAMVVIAAQWFRVAWSRPTTTPPPT